MVPATSDVRASARPRAVLLGCVLALTIPASAPAATTFGANLATVPDAPYGCEARPSIFGLAPTQINDCTWYSGATPLGGTHLVPGAGPGVVTRARVRTGARGGPMRFTLLTFTRNAADLSVKGTQCCFFAAESPIFQAPPNSVVDLPVRLPTFTGVVEGQANPNFLTGNILAISLLQGADGRTATMPVRFVSGAASASYHPGVKPGQIRNNQAAIADRVVVMNGVVESDANRNGLGDETQEPAAPPPAPPVATPVPGAGGAGGAGNAGGGAGDAGDAGSAAEAAKDPAKLEVLRAGVDDGRLDVLAEITKRAEGEVKVSFESAGRTTTFTEDIDSSKGRIRFRKLLPRAMRSKGTGIMTMEFAGSDRVRGDELRLRAARGKANLERETTKIEAGRLEVAGTITSRARGVVRIRMRFVDADGTLGSFEKNAKISRGKWKLDEALPAAAAARGGQLSIQFTGYEPRNIRGEQAAKQVRPG